jgi:hypothetical protein
MSAIPLQLAVELLGVDDSTVYTSARYKEFLIRGDDKENYFDYDSFMKRNGKMDEAYNQVGLFVEYLNKELGYSYQDIGNFVAKHSSINAKSLAGSLWKNDFSPKKAIMVGVVYKRFAPELVNAFDEYYGNRQTLKAKVKRVPKWNLF